MSNTPHELTVEFPQYHSLIHHLKETDGHFARLFEKYHEVNGVIHRVETDVEPADDFRITALRKERMQLKDELYGMLTHHEPEAEDPAQ